jgi:hypothetical protein
VEGIEFQNMTSLAKSSALKDHKEKNGLVTASGTAGGRNPAASVADKQKRRAGARMGARVAKEMQDAFLRFSGFSNRFRSS